MFRVGNRIPTLCKSYKNYNDSIKEIINKAIESNEDGSCLLRLLKVAVGIEERDLNSVTDLIEVALGHYSVIQDRIDAYGFVFDNDGERIIMNPTLEDILYLNGLPIFGEPVIPDDSRDPQAFHRVFRDDILNSHGIAEDLTMVNKYAWGAALLAYLHLGMKNYKIKNLNNVKGFTPIIVAFFLYRIPKLQEELGISVQKMSTPTLLLSPVLNALRGVCHIKRGIDRKSQNVFDHLTDEDIVWKPYAPGMLRLELVEQLN